MPGFGKGSSIDHMPQSLSPTRRKLPKTEVRGRLFRLSFTSVAGLLAACIIFYVLLRGLQPEASFVEAHKALEGTFQCSEASALVRDAIDYGQDPCEDFFAFACDKRSLTATAQGQREVAVRKVRDILVTLAMTGGHQDVSRKVAFFYKSCLVAISSPIVDLRENAEILYGVLNKTIDKVRSMSTIVQMIDFAAELSLRYGVFAFVSFIFSPNGSLALSFSKPFLRYSDENNLRWVFSSWLGHVQLPRNDTDVYVDNLMTLDKELYAASHGTHYFEDIFLERLSDITGKKVGTEELLRILNSYRPSQLKPLTKKSMVTIPGIKGTKKVFSILFNTVNVSEVAEYLVLHALLPQSLLQLNRLAQDDGACFNLTRRTFKDVWNDLTAYLLVSDDRNGDAHLMIANIMVALKKLVSQKFLFATPADVSTAIAKLDRIEVKLLKPEITSVEKRMKGLDQMNASSLYKNILELGRFTATKTADDISNLSTPLKRVIYSNHSLIVPTEALKPPLYCHGVYSFLNYATLGVASAEALLSALDGPFAADKHNRSHNYSQRTDAKLKDVKQCLALSVSRIAADGVASETWPRKLQSSVGALQTALEASLVEIASDSQVDDLMKPAMEQTFFARYCQRLCAGQSENISGDTVVPPNVLCNVAVMNLPRFTTLFGCVRGDEMMPSRQCSVL